MANFRKILISGANAHVGRVEIGAIQSTTNNTMNVVVRDQTTGELFITGTYANAGSQPEFPGTYQGNIELTVDAGLSTSRNIFLGSGRTVDGSASIDFITSNVSANNGRGLSISREEGLNGSSSITHYGDNDLIIDLADGDNSNVNSFKIRDGNFNSLVEFKSNGRAFFHDLRSVQTTNNVYYDTATDELSYYPGGSTQRIKKNIKDLDPSIVENFDKIRPVTFEYKRNPNVEVGGFIAEELDQVHPILVEYAANYQVSDEGKFLFKEPLVNDEIVPHNVQDRAILAAIVAKIQELDKKIQELKKLKSDGKL